ncbi:ribose-5-phosphate isomerase RpiA [Lacticaseibacillus pabuli]|uniref:Ribose-5-phosphate isomerase A n=1 Tax=Lacticaseibacillus pabuli TaxID=3025672 RepID=A0ABY7WT35_9LACO|nr:ribose-5-phosphate isomerase RpiA [Lacticaseibacillus sp. KACC 23028]WDF83323.1 ribose-5-phosphate isomerase RpiA [Lacticaseibacillus sp. KACC 23028]
MDQSELKKVAAERAAEFVEDGMTLGLGTGSTVFFLVEAIARRVKAENLHIEAVATSSRTAKQASDLGITMKDINDVDHIDLCIDGADEIDKHYQGIKGGGAAHTLEKMVATTSRRNIWIVDESKLVDTLGKFPLPTEVIPFGCEQVFHRLDAEGLHPQFRLDDSGQRVTTHNKNFVIDLHMGKIDHPHLLKQFLDGQVGILEHGLFLDLVDTVVVGTQDGAKVLPAIR